MTSPTFEQSGKPIRYGSVVGIDYGADVDFGTIVNLCDRHVHVRIRGTKRIVIVHPESLFPYEDQDMDPDLVCDGCFNHPDDQGRVHWHD